MKTQGWRIEIKKYPKLTEIGSQRSPYGNRKKHTRVRQYAVWWFLYTGRS
ncbi:MAG: family 20 glycosylhydrolase [Bacteroides cellulosilyticus]